MRGFVSFILAGALVVIALDVTVPPSGIRLAVPAWSASEKNATDQVVDRTHKSDRLQVPLANGRRMSPTPTPAILSGCEPVFSPLSASSRANFAGRCLA